MKIHWILEEVDPKGITTQPPCATLLSPSKCSCGESFNNSKVFQMAPRQPHCHNQFYTTPSFYLHVYLFCVPKPHTPLPIQYFSLHSGYYDAFHQRKALQIDDKLLSFTFVEYHTCTLFLTSHLPPLAFFSYFVKTLWLVSLHTASHSRNILRQRLVCVIIDRKIWEASPHLRDWRSEKAKK